MITASLTDLECCTAGSENLPSGVLRPFAARPGIAIKDEISLHVMRLLTLHPNLVKFHFERLAEMDVDTKKCLLEDIYEALGIKLAQ